METAPTKPGIYWARTYYSKEFNHIINIKGESPFLNYVGWNLNYPLHTPTEDNGLVGVNPTKFIFVNTLQEYLKTDVKIDSPKISGIYWIVSKKPSTNLSLAYITGSQPYMSCYTWDICSDIREQNINAGDLTYLMKVEEPKHEE